MTLEAFERIAERFGVPVALAVGLIAVLGWVAYRLVSEKKGILTAVTARHIAFVDSVETQGQQMQATVSRFADAQQHNVRHARNLTRAFEHHASAMQDIADGIGPEVGQLVSEHVEAMKRELRAE